MSGGKLEKLLNEHASQGWQLKAITSADVKGRVGPGGPRACLSPSSAYRIGRSPQARTRRRQVILNRRSQHGAVVVGDSEAVTSSLHGTNGRLSSWQYGL